MHCNVKVHNDFESNDSCVWANHAVGVSRMAAI